MRSAERPGASRGWTRLSLSRLVVSLKVRSVLTLNRAKPCATDELSALVRSIEFDSGSPALIVSSVVVALYVVTTANADERSAAVMTPVSISSAGCDCGLQFDFTAGRAGRW